MRLAVRTPGPTARVEEKKVFRLKVEILTLGPESIGVQYICTDLYTNRGSFDTVFPTTLNPLTWAFQRLLSQAWNAEICSFYGNDGAGLRCATCRAMYFCSKHCQQQDWRYHKKSCRANTSDDTVSDTVAETALARLIARETARLPPAPEYVTCYICVERGGGDLMRGGCAEAPPATCIRRAPSHTPA